MVRRPFASGLSQSKTIGFEVGFIFTRLHLLTCSFVCRGVLARPSALASVRALPTEVDGVVLHARVFQKPVSVALQEPYVDERRDERLAFLGGHQLVERGKALYIGISNYNREQTEAAVKAFRALRTPFILNQVCYNLLDRTIEENGLKAYAEEEGVGLVIYSPLAQGLLTERYTHGIPADSRMRKSGSLKEEKLTPALLKKLSMLREIAEARGQTLAELALSWTLKDRVVSSVIIGASSSEQILENIKVNPDFTAEELSAIEAICKA